MNYLKRESALDDLGNSESIQIVIDSRVRTYSLLGSALEIRPTLWLDNVWLMHKRLGIDSFNHLSKNQEQR